MTITHVNNLKQLYKEALKQAKSYIIENLFWSEGTFYRKMKQKHKLTDAENEVIANAYRQFLHEPLSQLLTNVNHQ